MHYLLVLLFLSSPAYSALVEAPQRFYLTDVVLSQFLTQPGGDDPQQQYPGAIVSSITGYFTLLGDKVVLPLIQ